MSNDAETKENVREDVYNEELLDKLLDENDIDQFRDEFYLCTITNKVSTLRTQTIIKDKKYLSFYLRKK